MEQGLRWVIPLKLGRLHAPLNLPKERRPLSLGLLNLASDIWKERLGLLESSKVCLCLKTPSSPRMSISKRSILRSQRMSGKYFSHNRACHGQTIGFGE